MTNRNWNGSFWLAGSEQKANGSYTALAGEQPTVVLEEPIVDDPTIKKFVNSHGELETRFSIDAKASVEAFKPILIHGTLVCGADVSLLSAQNFSGGGTPPKYKARTAIIGAHVRNGQLFDGLRFQLDDQYWTGHLIPGDSSTTTDGAVIRVDHAPEGSWIVYEAASPRSLRDLEQYVALACIVLFHLAFDFRPRLREVEVRIDSGPWLKTLSSRLHDKPKDADIAMLPREEISVDKIAAWLDLNSKLDGLASAVVEPPSGAVQAQALVATTLIEGIHRRLPYNQARFSNLSGKAIDRIRREARRSAARQAEAEGSTDSAEIKDVVGKCVSHFEDVDYNDRASDIVDEVFAAVPELSNLVSDMPKLLKKARNELAHHLVERSSYEDLVDVLRYWTIASLAAPWILRFLLLLRVGVDAKVLREKALKHQRFAFVLANISEIASELEAIDK